MILLKNKIDFRMFVPIAFIGCIILSPIFGTWLNILAVVIFMFSGLFNTIYVNYVLLFLAFPFANIFKLSPDTLSLLTVCEIMLCTLMLKGRSLRLYKKNSGFLLAFLIYILFISLFSIRNFQITTVLKNAVHLIILFHLFQSNEADVNYEKLAKNCSIALSLSMIVMLLLSTVNGYMELLADFLRVVQYGGGLQLTRNCGLFTDPNYCSIAIIMTMAFSSVLYYYHIIGQSFWLLTVPLVYLGFTTYSRTFLFGIGIFVVLLVILVLFPKHRFWGAVIPIILSILIVLALEGRFTVVNLLLNRFNVDADISNGRLTLNSVYLRYIISNPFVLLFGQGINETRIENFNNVHNLYIEMVYKIGLFGSVLFLYLLSRCFLHNNLKKPLATRIPLVLFLILYFSIAGFSSFELVYYLIICGMVSFFLPYQVDQSARRQQPKQEQSNAPKNDRDPGLDYQRDESTDQSDQADAQDTLPRISQGL